MISESVRAQIEALVTEREGMVADNAQRAHFGESMAYVGNDFQVIADRIRAFASSPAEQPAPVAWSRSSNDEQKPAVTVEELERAMLQALLREHLNTSGTRSAARICAAEAMRLLKGEGR